MYWQTDDDADSGTRHFDSNHAVNGCTLWLNTIEQNFRVVIYMTLVYGGILCIRKQEYDMTSYDACLDEPSGERISQLVYTLSIASCLGYAAHFWNRKICASQSPQN